MSISISVFTCVCIYIDRYCTYKYAHKYHFGFVLETTYCQMSRAWRQPHMMPMDLSRSQLDHASQLQKLPGWVLKFRVPTLLCQLAWNIKNKVPPTRTMGFQVPCSARE